MALERTKATGVAILGWATGGMWASYYASLYPESVHYLAVLNSLYGGSDRHAMFGPGTQLEDPKRPGRFNESAVGAYRLNTAASLVPSWDNSISAADNGLWRDPLILRAYVEAALASDPTAATRTPPSFRSPSGALEDSFYQACGRQLFDA